MHRGDKREGRDARKACSFLSDARFAVSERKNQSSNNREAENSSRPPRSLPCRQNPDLTLLARGVKVSIASNAEREAGAPREAGADEGRAFVDAGASAAPAWPAEATMMSFWFSSIETFVVVAAAAAVSKAASGTIFTVIELGSGKRGPGRVSLWVREEEREEAAGQGGKKEKKDFWLCFFFLSLLRYFLKDSYFCLSLLQPRVRFLSLSFIYPSLSRAFHAELPSRVHFENQCVSIQLMTLFFPLLLSLLSLSSASQRPTPPLLVLLLVLPPLLLLLPLLALFFTPSPRR